MASLLTPYLSFDGNAREALEFYRDVFGGELDINTFGSLGHPDAPEADLVMHGQLETAAGFTMMGADTPPGMTYEAPAGITVMLSGDDESLRTQWARLADGGTVGTELATQVWGDEYGDLVDRFGTPWGFNISARSE
ncbi:MULTISPECIES: VOC family protein [unclassified Nocardioides]|uniref:VOC family protein n=1 Tax=unclassified Nocardioides TaxID=2615069 RepID=UPI0006F5CFF1|nr:MULTISPECIES: VOC family protein [unclassified Nocardioides]KQY57267.1 3-demethylubiquinone-9 3-methyltransferase [Nocardioides sp. Root140]KRF11910.1 3-demethylubiquinone-9 3-methyltransferase [Nocardioides sp. Soil796]